MMLMRLFQCELRWWCDGWIHKSKMESEDEDQESIFIRIGATSHPTSASSNSAECSHIPRIDELYENGEGEGEDRLISFRSERRARRRPFDVNLKPRHKHVSRVGGGGGGKADRGRKRREDGACDAESDFGS